MKSVLICDSDMLSRRNMKTMLKERGFNVICETSNGQDAVSVALDKIPDLLIIDSPPSGKEAIATTAAIRKRASIPVIFLTSSPELETLKQALRTGVAAFLTKPLREQDLLPAIELAMAHNVEVEHLREQVEELKETLETRKLIERAKGRLIESGLSEEAAFRRMQKLAMDNRKPMRKIAEAILQAGSPG